MKSLIIAALVAGQALAAQPAFAAELPSDQASAPTRVGSFAGARLRVPLGATKERPHAGLAVTATQRTGETGALRFSKGLELGFAGDDKVRLSLAGKPVSQLRQGADAPGGQKLGFSTTGWIIIGASAVIIVGGILIFDYLGDQSE